MTKVRKRPEQPAVEDVVGAIRRAVRVLRHVVSGVPPGAFVDQLAAGEAPAVGPGCRPDILLSVSRKCLPEKAAADRFAFLPLWLEKDLTLVKFRSKGSSPTIAAWPCVTVYSGAWPSELAEAEACVSSSSTWPSVNPV